MCRAPCINQVLAGSPLHSLPSRLYTHTQITPLPLPLHTQLPHTTHMHTHAQFPLDRSTEQRRHSQSTHAVHHGQVTSERPRWTNEEHVLTQQVLSRRHRQRHYQQTSGMLSLGKLWIHTCTHFMPYISAVCNTSAVFQEQSVLCQSKPCINHSTILSNCLLSCSCTVRARQQLTPDSYYTCRTNNSVRLSMHNRSQQIFPCT